MKNTFKKNEGEKSNKALILRAAYTPEKEEKLKNRRITKTFVAPFKESSLFYNPDFLIR